MTYYSPLWVFDGEVTTSTEVANFKMEGYSENMFAHALCPISNMRPYKKRTVNVACL